MTPQEFYGQFFPYAQAVSQRTGLDPRLVLAQAALETGYGKSAPGMNYFGIKSHGRSGGQTLQTSEFEGGRMVSQPASFRGYESPEQSFEDYADFLLSNPRYGGVLSAVGIENQIAEMAKSGYATDPQYGAKLASIANKFDPNSAPIIGADALRAIGKGPSGNVTRSTKQGDSMEPITQPQQRQGLLGGFFGPEGADARARLAIGLEGLMLNPNQALIGQLQQGIESRETARQRNATVDWLRSRGRDDLAQAMEGGLPAAEAMRIAMTPADPMAAINLEKAHLELERLRGPQPTLTGDKLSALNTIRDDVRAELAPFEIVKQGYNNITTFYSNPSGTSDYALAVAFAKILDPGSVAREGEVAAVQNAGARVPALGQALKNAVTGEGSLTPEVRQQIAELATQIYTERAAAAQTTLQGYTRLAEQAGVPPEFIYSGMIPEAQAVIPAVVPQSAVALGVTQEDWDAMTQEERKAFMGGQ